MRLRNKPWVKEYLIEKKHYLIEFNKEKFLNNYEIFKNNNKVNLEIGCGKGSFITTKALLNTSENFIGMEKVPTVIGIALKRSLKKFEESNKKMCNLKYFNYFAENLSLIFPENSIDKIYLNFSDPWPKSRHEEKRLTSEKFLNMYAKIIKSKGILEFKTDNDGLFNFSLNEIEMNKNWKIVSFTRDLYNNKEMLEKNIATEYETKFHKMNKNINKLIIIKTF